MNMESGPPVGLKKKWIESIFQSPLTRPCLEDSVMESGYEKTGLGEYWAKNFAMALASSGQPESSTLN